MLFEYAGVRMTGKCNGPVVNIQVGDPGKLIEDQWSSPDERGEQQARHWYPATGKVIYQGAYQHGFTLACCGTPSIGSPSS